MRQEDTRAQEDIERGMPSPEELAQKHTFLREEIIIDGVGTYLNRKGQTVTIDEIGDLKYSFNCKGSIHHRRVGKKTRYEFNIWAPNGAYCGIGIHPLDIVSKVK